MIKNFRVKEFVKKIIPACRILIFLCCLLYTAKYSSLQWLRSDMPLQIWIKAIFITITPNIFLLLYCLYFFNNKIENFLRICLIKPFRKYIWGLNIQRFSTTSLAIFYTFLLTFYITCLLDISQNSQSKEYADGASQIMIAIGTGLMAMLIFVFEYTTKKTRDFDKYFYLALPKFLI
jgi:hypothetical protein